MADGVEELGTISSQSIIIEKGEHCSFPATIKSGEGVIAPGMLFQKEGLNKFVADVGTGGINTTVTTIPLANDAGSIIDGSTIRINNEFIKVGTYASGTNEFTGCTRSIRGSVAGTHDATDEVLVIDTGDIDEKFVKYNGLEPLEGVIIDDIDATSEDVPCVLFRSVAVMTDGVSAANDDVFLPAFDRNSFITFVEEV